MISVVYDGVGVDSQEQTRMRMILDAPRSRRGGHSPGYHNYTLVPTRRLKLFTRVAPSDALKYPTASQM